MQSFVRQLITEWRRLKLPLEGETVIVAVSGGADSVSLLLALHALAERKKLGHRIVAAHFNHNLRGAKSDADEEYVRQLTTTLGVELAVGHGNISSIGNLEQNARDARYTFLGATAANLHAFAVVTGHTVNDQAETFLLNLIRGSGPEGLSGMKSLRSFKFQVPSSQSKPENSELGTRKAELLLVRPLLKWAMRGDTEAFCHEQGIPYRYDTMNEDTAFKRVRIRKILLPLLKDMNPKIVETLAQTASLMPEGAAPAIEITDFLELKHLKTLEKAERYDLFRSWLRFKRGTVRLLQLKHIESIERLAFSDKSGRAAELPGGAKVIKSAGKLQYVENIVDKTSRAN